MPDPTSTAPADIERQIEATRAHLSGTIDQLTERVKPANLAREGSEQVRAKVTAATRNADGSLRTERLAAAGGVVVAVLALFLARRRRRRRRG